MYNIKLVLLIGIFCRSLKALKRHKLATCCLGHGTLPSNKLFIGAHTCYRMSNQYAKYLDTVYTLTHASMITTYRGHNCWQLISDNSATIMGN